jgi:hypothetical protein
VWIWKDEQMHAEYLRGELLRRGGLGSAAVVYGHQIQGAISGWTSATSNHRRLRTAPFRAGAASVLISVAGVLGRIPSALQGELRFQTFRRYCELNIALESSAELAYRRLIELTDSDGERRTLERIREDEMRHRDAFALMVEILTADDRLASRQSSDRLTERFSEISPWFVPAALRRGKGASTGGASFGSRLPVAVGVGRRDQDKLAVLESCLDRAGLAALASRSTSAVIRASFMLGYDRRDRSNVNDPELVDGVARYLAATGCRCGRPRSADRLRQRVPQPLGRRRRRVFRFRFPVVPRRRHQPGSSADRVRARLRPAGHQRRRGWMPTCESSCRNCAPTPPSSPI